MNFNNTFAKAMKRQLDQGRRAQFSMLIKATLLHKAKLIQIGKSCILISFNRKKQQLYFVNIIYMFEY